MNQHLEARRKIAAESGDETLSPDYVTSRTAPRWAWDVIDTALKCIHGSTALTDDCRHQIDQAREAMKDLNQ